MMPWLPAREQRRRHLARAPRRSADQLGARAALTFPTAKLPTGQSNFITQNEQEWSIWIGVNRMLHAVHVNFVRFTMVSHCPALRIAKHL